jgi:flagellar biosynthesis/type III secretory pathway chaperone
MQNLDTQIEETSYELRRLEQTEKEHLNMMAIASVYRRMVTEKRNTLLTQRSINDMRTSLTLRFNQILSDAEYTRKEPAFGDLIQKMEQHLKKWRTYEFIYYDMKQPVPVTVAMVGECTIADE